MHPSYEHRSYHLLTRTLASFRQNKKMTSLILVKAREAWFSVCFESVSVSAFQQEDSSSRIRDDGVGSLSRRLSAEPVDALSSGGAGKAFSS
jgi:hypothetical protein